MDESREAPGETWKEEVPSRSELVERKDDGEIRAPFPWRAPSPAVTFSTRA